MNTDVTTPEDVRLVLRTERDGRDEIHAYFQPYEGVMKAHIRRVTILADGKVNYTGKGIAVPVEAGRLHA